MNILNETQHITINEYCSADILQIIKNELENFRKMEIVYIKLVQIK